MQDHRATISSMSELFDLDHGSSSSNTSVDQQFLWDDIQDPEQTQELENLPSRTSTNPFNHEQQNLFEDRGYAQISSMFSLNNVHVDPPLEQGSSARSFPVNLNECPVFIGQGSESSPLVEVPEIFRSDASEFQSANFSEGGSSRPSSSTEGRHLPCKRKSFHVENGESSSGPSNPGLPEVTEPRLTLGDSGRTERLRRNFRLLINSLGQNDQDSPVPYSNAQSSVPSSGIIMPENIDTVGNDADALPQPPAIHIPPPLPPNGLSVRWNRGRNSASSSSREGGSTSHTNHQTNILEHLMFASGNESSGFVPNPVVGVGSGSAQVTGNVPGASRSGIPSDTHQSSSQSTRQMQYPRRLSEYVRRSLSSVGSESDTIGHNINFAAPTGAAAPQEVAVPSRSSGSRARHALPLRSAYAERQADHAVGLPYSIRSLTAASEGRRRLVSEALDIPIITDEQIRSVLDMMRRGEGLRFEDFMILDQSVFLGVSDMHDRHRDMRLDVDNMSYEELLALEERIGNVNTGLSEETILARMKQRKCVITIDHTHNETEPCSICREEYKDGEDVGTLECRHDFHRDCIKQWLLQKNICPICKTTGLKT